MTLGIAVHDGERIYLAMDSTGFGAVRIILNQVYTSVCNPRYSFSRRNRNWLFSVQEDCCIGLTLDTVTSIARILNPPQLKLQNCLMDV